MEIKVMSYGMNYRHITLETKGTQGHYACLIMNILKEIERGFLPKKIYKPTKLGTKIVYEAVYKNTEPNVNLFNDLIEKFKGIAC